MCEGCVSIRNVRISGLDHAKREPFSWWHGDTWWYGGVAALSAAWARVRKGVRTITIFPPQLADDYQRGFRVIVAADMKQWTNGRVEELKLLRCPRLFMLYLKTTLPTLSIVRPPVCEAPRSSSLIWSIHLSLHPSLGHIRYYNCTQQEKRYVKQKYTTSPPHVVVFGNTARRHEVTVHLTYI